MIQVSDHAIRRYRQRCDSKYRSNKIKAKLIDMWERGTPAVIKKEYRAFQMAKHGADNVSEYRIRGNFVIVASKGTIVTLHLNESERFEPSPHLKLSKLKEKVFRLAIKYVQYRTIYDVSDLKVYSKFEELADAARKYDKALDDV